MKKTNIVKDLKLRIDGDPRLLSGDRELMACAIEDMNKIADKLDKLEKYEDALKYIAKHGRPSVVADVAKEALKE